MMKTETSIANMNNTHGFTLIELMVVVAIIGVLGAIAYPSYDSYTKKSKRADAKVALTKIADRQERYYLQNNIYTTVLADLGLVTTSDDGYYNVAIATGDVNGFSATATATTGQTNDTQCTSFTLDATGKKTSNGNPDDSANCW